ncbi:MAG: hypothetical protein Q7R79_03430 [bacterium]|nr:hypothetical protein [bacterium]
MINKDEHIKTSPVYMGYLILRHLKHKKNEKVMIWEIATWLHEEFGLVHYRQLVFALVFLYQAGIIDFANPYIYTK